MDALMELLEGVVAVIGWLSCGLLFRRFLVFRLGRVLYAGSSAAAPKVFFLVRGQFDAVRSSHYFFCTQQCVWACNLAPSRHGSRTRTCPRAPEPRP